MFLYSKLSFSFTKLLTIRVGAIEKDTEFDAIDGAGSSQHGEGIHNITILPLPPSLPPS